ncbi:MAG: hypothetical protein ABIN01_20085 [Ferruginibacter sp.]
MKVVLLLSLVLGLLGTGCKKNETNSGGNSSTPTIPTVTTANESVVTSNSLTTGGNVTSDGGSAILARGVCWRSINSAPTINDTKTVDGVGTGTFSSVISGVSPFTAYYVRAYATNAVGTAYGNEIVVLTKPGLVLSVTDVYEENNIRKCDLQISIKGFSDPSSLAVTQTGVCWGKSQNPTTADSKVLSGPVSVIYTRFTLTLFFGINSTYYIRPFATTSAGTTYGNQVTYTTGVDIGLSHEGGIIFYIDNTGQHGLVAAPTDQGTAVPWAPGNLFTTVTNASSYTDGVGNTTKIITKYGASGSYAAKLCKDYRGGGFTDWYLPAADQVFRMKIHQDVIGGFHGSAFLANYYYWSSSENNYFSAWGYELNPRYTTVSAFDKSNLLYVRAIRNF